MSRFLNTKGRATLGIGLCMRCQKKFPLDELREDGNLRNFYVCHNKGCWDNYDPFRLPAPPPDDVRLPFIRPDVSLTIQPDGLPPIEPDREN